MSTHPAVVTVTPSGPLEILNVPTATPEGNEVKILVEWTASTPLDMHQATSHLLVNPPQILGDGLAGTVAAVGPDVRRYKPGDKVFGFTWRNAKEKVHQLYCVAPENLVGLIPKGFTMAEAVTLPNNFVTAWHTLTADLGFELPWNRGTDGKAKGKPEGYKPPKEQVETANGQKKWILVWGGSSSCGQFFIQLLKYYGYQNVITVAGEKHHERLRGYGATKAFDYRGQGNVVDRIKDFVKHDGGEIAYAIDCIGSLDGSVRPVSKIVESKGCKIAILLPVIVRDAGPGVQPMYEMDVEKSADWKQGVVPVGVRTHFWLDNKFLAENLEAEIMPWALGQKIVEPNDQVIVEGATLLERAQKAIDMLRDKAVSGGRLVWRIAEDDQTKAALKQI